MKIIKNGKRIKIILLFCFLIFVIVVIMSNEYISGRELHPNSITITYLNVENNKIQLKGRFLASAEVYKKYKYRIDGDKLYIKIYTALCGGGDIDISITGDFSMINEVYIEGVDNERMIWSID